MFFWLRRERQQRINTETGFGWFNDRLISPPVRVQETCSVTARKRPFKHWCLWQAAAEGNSSRDAMDIILFYLFMDIIIILSLWFCTPRFWELSGEGNIKRVAGSILNQVWRTQHINSENSADENPECHILVSSQTMWEYQDAEEKNQCKQKIMETVPKHPDANFWASSFGHLNYSHVF